MEGWGTGACRGAGTRGAPRRLCEREKTGYEPSTLHAAPHTLGYTVATPRRLCGACGVTSRFENNYFAEMRSGSEARIQGSQTLYHSSLGSRVIKNKKKAPGVSLHSPGCWVQGFKGQGGRRSDQSGRTTTRLDWSGDYLMVYGLWFLVYGSRFSCCAEVQRG